jgi:hypothetical protein
MSLSCCRALPLVQERPITQAAVVKIGVVDAGERHSRPADDRAGQDDRREAGRDEAAARDVCLTRTPPLS